MPTVPNPNSTPESAAWDRWVTDELVALRREISRRQVDSLATDKGQTATVNGLIRTIEALREQQDTLSDQQDTLASQQATLSNQINFLENQTVYDSRANMSNYVGSNSGTTWEAYNSTYDPAVTITTGDSGRLNVLASAMLTGGDIEGLIGMEIVGVSGPSWPGPQAGIVVDATAMGAFSTQVTLSPNTSYIIRLRRGRGGVISGAVIWGYLSLAVTKLG